MKRALATGLGLVLDRALGEPPAAVHPVAAFGSVMQRVEQRLYRDDRVAGAAYAAVGVALGAAAGVVVRRPSTAVAIAAAGRALRGAAADVRDALEAGDVDRARTMIPRLVGRDPASLDASGLAAATIESLAENTVDAVVAPVLWAVIGGAPGVLAYRAVNTMDAMVGHRSERYERFGWASARLDDVANFVPARLTALLVAAVRPRYAGAVTHAVTTQARTHPSPNAGVAEAAFAAALGVELGGPLRYGNRDEMRPLLGAGPRPEVRHIDGAITLASHVELALAGALAVSSLARRRGAR